MRIGIAAAAALVMLGVAAPLLAEQRAVRQASPQIDRDQSGTITRDEWTFRPERFNAADLNKDGVLTLDELATWKAGASRIRQRSTQQARDRTVDRARFRALREARVLERARARVRALDRARTRALDRARARTVDSARVRRALRAFGRERYRALDLDRNGVISRDEWRRPVHVFDRLDGNNDGVLSRDELRRPRWRPRTLR